MRNQIQILLANKNMEDPNAASMVKTNAMSDVERVQPVTLSVQDLAIQIPQKSSLFGKSKKDSLQILQKMSFEVGPGQVVAIIGASGSGKTSLLQVLAG